ncbi:MAG: oligosaccharide flippase family protein, partial [Bacteroidota bacterium]
MSDFFSSGHQRTLKAKKNILATFFLKGMSIAISLILVPLTINYINPTRYGIWLTLSAIVGWFNFFDIGFGNGLRNRFAEAVARGQHELARIYVSTTYAMLMLIISFIIMVFLGINSFLNWTNILNAPDEMAAELSMLALIVFVFFCLKFVLQLVTTIMTANQQPAKASFFNMLGSVFALIIIFILTKTTSGSLIYLGIAISITPVLVLIASSLWFYNRGYRKYRPSLKFVKFKYARNLMSLGVKFFIIEIASIILYQSSNVIIAQLFGPAEVTPYNIAYKYFGIMPLVFSIIMTPFWSAYTEAYAIKDFTWIKNSIKKLKFVWLVLSVIVIIMLIFSENIYILWVGDIVHVPYLLSIVLAFYVIINAWCGIFSQFLNGVGKIKLQLYAGLIGALINIPLAVFLGREIGIAGVVLSTCLLAIIG